MSLSWYVEPCCGGEMPACCKEMHVGRNVHLIGRDAEDAGPMGARDAESAVEWAERNTAWLDVIVIYSCGAVRVTGYDCGRELDPDGTRYADFWGGNIAPDGIVLPTFPAFLEELQTDLNVNVPNTGWGDRPHLFPFETWEDIAGRLPEMKAKHDAKLRERLAEHVARARSEARLEDFMRSGRTWMIGEELDEEVAVLTEDGTTGGTQP